jgi:TonB-dependent receptor
MFLSLLKRAGGIVFLLVVLLQYSVVAQHTITGRVLSKDGPLIGAVVAIPNTQWGTNTDTAGKFIIKDVPSGKYIVEYNYAGYEKKTMNITVGKKREKEEENIGDVVLKEDAKQISEVTIKGAMKKGSEIDALHLTKASTKIVTVLSQEGMSKLPDKNVAEAVQRVAGAKMERNKGEGSNISLRGTPGDWTATLVNGDRLPTADEENPSRTFEFEVFPSNLVDYIFVTRSVTPDFEADNVGGAVNFQTIAPAEKRTIKANIGSGANLIAGKPLYDVNFTYGDISKNKKWSFSLSGSYYTRPYGADAFLLTYGSPYNHSINRVELKDYFGDRTTIGSNAVVQFKPNDKLTFAAHFMQGSMDDDKYQYKLGYYYFDGSGKRYHMFGSHGILQRRLYGGDVSAEWKISPKVTIDYKVAAYKNTFQYGQFPNKSSNNDEKNGYTTFDFISPLIDDLKDMVYTDDFGKALPQDQGGVPYKYIGADDPVTKGGGDPYNHIVPKPVIIQPVTLAVTDFSLNRVYSEYNHTIEKDPIVFQTNLKYKLSDKVSFKFGIKSRYKEGSRDLSFYEWGLNTVQYNGLKLYLTSYQLGSAPRNSTFLSEIGSTYKGQIFPFLTKDQMNSFIPNLKDTLFTRKMDMYNSDIRLWAGGHYKYQETVNAGYFMTEISAGDKWKIVGGLRIENTHLYETGDTIDFNKPVSYTDSAKNITYTGHEIASRTIDKSYIAFLPSLNADYSINEKSELRLAISRTFHRPNFEETKPGAPLIRFDNQEFILGNPNLKPTYSNNLDATYQLFIGKKDLITIGAYYKHVQDHIFLVIGGYDSASFLLIQQYQNASSSDIVGFEANIDKHFDFLPRFWSGFGINANVTYSYSQMHVPGRPAAQGMTEQTPLLYNIGVYYERGKVSTKLALNYTGPYLLALNLAAIGGVGLVHKDTDYDLFRGEMYSLDYQASVKISKRFTAYLEASNLLDAPYKTYVGKDWRPRRIEYYHQRLQVGMKFEL